MANDLTRTSPEPSGPAPAPSRPGGRFVAGTVLAGRYRIVSLLGIGGMGEVYKADDLKLEQEVALKFLPDSLAMSPSALARFHAEARIARQVSHPNVCRVYDIGDVDGLQFLTMEFIDGEDLASLLRRIGRLPADKALEIARQLCAGVAAAHDAGVLHRDLKPHNVMIDGRGRARVTDFGVAAIAREVRQANTVAGTPAYMAPEQLRGEDASIRSDVYALGLVLYELFTGKRAIQAGTLAEAVLYYSSASTITTPAELIRDLDPLVERVILRCLEKDPAARPASAIQVAAALPGGDPLHAALLAGETPSPEMVAAAGSNEAMRPAVAIALAIATVVVVASGAVARQQFTLLGRAGDVSPAVLSFRATEMLTALGYGDRGHDHASGLERDVAYLEWDRRNRPAAGRIDRVSTARPAALYFWYRESQSPLFVVIGTESGRPVMPLVSLRNPPPLERGMKHLRLDLTGRLIEFVAVPLETDAALPPKPMDWNVVFTSAGLDRTTFQPAASSWTPQVAVDETAAWTGAYPEQPDLPVRLEAAAYRGRLVSLRSLGPWPADAPRLTTMRWVEAILPFAILTGSVLVAWFNVRTGRIDRIGATRLSLVIFLLSIGAWSLGAHHAVADDQFRQFRNALSQAMMAACSMGLAYLAVEPHIRRRWPGVLVSWSRLIAGRWRDPLVGRDLLIGLALGTAGTLVSFVMNWLASHTMDSATEAINSMISARTALATIVALPLGAITLSLLFTAVLLAVRVVFRLNLFVFAAAMMLGGLVSVGGAAGFAVGAFFGLLESIALVRFGLVALVGVFLINFVSGMLRAAFAWDVGSGVFVVGGLVLLTGTAAWIAMGSPKVVKAQ